MMMIWTLQSIALQLKFYVPINTYICCFFFLLFAFEIDKDSSEEKKKL